MGLTAMRDLCYKHLDVDPSGWDLRVDELYLSNYECRSHEQIIYQRPIQLRGGVDLGVEPLALDVSGKEGDAPYLEYGHRLSHYREGHFGSSLIAKVGDVP